MNRVTRSQFARLCGVNRSTVTRWLQNGRIVADHAGMIDPEAAQRMRLATESPMPQHQARKAQFDEARAGDGAGGGHSEAREPPHAATRPIEADAPASERIGTALRLETYKLQRAKAELAAMEVDVRAGQLVERSDVDYVLADFGSKLRSMLGSMPDRLAGEIAAHQGNTNAIHRHLEEALHEALIEMSQHMERRMEAISGSAR